MANDLVIKEENMSLASAIETCCQHVADLKMSMTHSFSNLETEISGISSSYNGIAQRMDVLEKIVSSMSSCENHRHQCCDEVLRKVNNLESILRTLTIGSRSCSSKDTEDSNSDIGSSPIVLIRNNKPAQVSASLSLDSSVQVITLNSESDYPDGSWLGDESNPELRVRCPISPPNLLHINTFCQTPEKMAVTLLDYLFPREVLAISNLSGKGKHGKRQLDPLMIYGIRCHLVHKFNIVERDWYRIKQNMDSKCRTAWRKKIKGLPLSRYKSDSNDSNSELQEYISEDGDAIILAAGTCRMGESLDDMETQVIHTTQGDIKVLHATPEQLVRIQETHHIQVLSEDLILPPVPLDLPQPLFKCIISRSKSKPFGRRTVSNLKFSKKAPKPITLKSLKPKLSKQFVNSITSSESSGYNLMTSDSSGYTTPCEFTRSKQYLYRQRNSLIKVFRSGSLENRNIASYVRSRRNFTKNACAALARPIKTSRTVISGKSSKHISRLYHRRCPGNTLINILPCCSSEDGSLSSCYVSDKKSSKHTFSADSISLIEASEPILPSMSGLDYTSGRSGYIRTRALSDSICSRRITELLHEGMKVDVSCTRSLEEILLTMPSEDIYFSSYK